MSETKHTPGPWHYRSGGSLQLEGDKEPRFYPPTVVKFNKNRQGLRTTAFIATCESTTLPNAANARLIAAAPDLLKVLKITAVWAPHNHEPNMDSNGHCPMCNAQAVIRKAEAR